MRIGSPTSPTVTPAVTDPSQLETAAKTQKAAGLMNDPALTIEHSAGQEAAGASQAFQLPAAMSGVSSMVLMAGLLNVNNTSSLVHATIEQLKGQHQIDLSNLHQAENALKSSGSHHHHHGGLLGFFADIIHDIAHLFGINISTSEAEHALSLFSGILKTFGKDIEHALNGLAKDLGCPNLFKDLAHDFEKIGEDALKDVAKLVSDAEHDFDKLAKDLGMSPKELEIIVGVVIAIAAIAATVATGGADLAAIGPAAAEVAADAATVEKVSSEAGQLLDSAASSIAGSNPQEAQELREIANGLDTVANIAGVVSQTAGIVSAGAGAADDIGALSHDVENLWKTPINFSSLSDTVATFKNIAGELKTTLQDAQKLEKDLQPALHSFEQELNKVDPGAGTALQHGLDRFNEVSNGIDSLLTSASSLASAVGSLPDSAEALESGIADFQGNFQNIGELAGSIDKTASSLQKDLSEVKSAINGVESSLKGIDPHLAAKVDPALNKFTGALNSLDHALGVAGSAAETVQSGAASIVKEGKALGQTGSQFLGEVKGLGSDVSSLRFSSFSQSISSITKLTQDLGPAIQSLTSGANEGASLLKNLAGQVRMFSPQFANKLTGWSSDLTHFGSTMGEVKGELSKAGPALNWLQQAGETLGKDANTLASTTINFHSVSDAFETLSNLASRAEPLVNQAGADLDTVQGAIQQFAQTPGLPSSIQNACNSAASKLGDFGGELQTVGQTLGEAPSEISTLSSAVSSFTGAIGKLEEVPLHFNSLSQGIDTVENLANQVQPLFDSVSSGSKAVSGLLSGLATDLQSVSPEFASKVKGWSGDLNSFSSVMSAAGTEAGKIGPGIEWLDQAGKTLNSDLHNLIKTNLDFSSVSGTLDTLTSLAKNATPLVQQTGSDLQSIQSAIDSFAQTPGLPSGITSDLDQVSSELGSLSSDATALDGVLGKVPSAVSGLSNMVASVESAAHDLESAHFNFSTLPDAISSMKNLSTSIGPALASLEKAAGDGSSLLSGLASDLRSVSPDASSRLTGWAGDMTQVQQGLQSIGTEAGKIGPAIDWFSQAESKLASDAKDVTATKLDFSSASDAIQSLTSLAKNAGPFITQAGSDLDSIQSGIKSVASDVTQVSPGLATALSDAANVIGTVASGADGANNLLDQIEGGLSSLQTDFS